MTNVYKSPQIPKSRWVAKPEVLKNIGEELNLVVSCFNRAINDEDLKRCLKKNPSHHAKGYQVSNIATYFSEELSKVFQSHCGMMSHDELKFDIGGYQIWFKKINNKTNRPSFNNTKLSNSLIDLSTMPFFQGFGEDIVDRKKSKSLLIMTYKIDEIGQVSSPQFSLVDKGVSIWTINEDDLRLEQNVYAHIVAEEQLVELNKKGLDQIVRLKKGV